MMKVSLEWLKQYVDIKIPVAELGRRLAMAGIEPEGIRVIGDWEKIVIGQIMAIEPHPNADWLTLVTVDLGTEQPTVVCGATNLSVGDKVPFAPVGAELVDGHTGKKVRLKSAKIRGVVSSGMVCSEMELGISDDHQGIMILHEEAPVGTPLADIIGDVIFDLEVTPNRPDCLSVIGVAREVAAVTGEELHLPGLDYKETDQSIDQQIAVEIVAPDLCPRYSASLITGITLGESPKWMQRRLRAAGMRPINNIVDITNYVMLAYGQPLHAFDYQTIQGQRIIVRRAVDGEVIVSLDGVERVLTADTLVIADEQRAVAIAGVMGAANSEVSAHTTSILLEAASFNPASIHYTGRNLRLPSEACMRFERGISPGMVAPALKSATQLIVELAGGKAARGVVDVYPGKRDRTPITLSLDKAKRLLGIDYSREKATEVLTSLGFDCDPADSDSALRATAPYWRSDIRLPVDLIEEVARISGYDNIPTTMLSEPIPQHQPDAMTSMKQQLNYSLTGYSFQEVVTYSLTSLERLQKLLPEPHPVDPTPLRVANPMTADQEYLRPNLRANLLTAFAANRRHEECGIRLFELGKVYLPRTGDLPEERDFLCGVMGGARIEPWWGPGGDGSIDFYDVKGVVEGLLAELGVEAGFTPGGDASLHPQRQAAIVCGNDRLGIIGEIHPKVVAAFDINEPVFLLEIDLKALLPDTVGHRIFQPIPRFPGVIRDMALVVDAGITHEQVAGVIQGFPLVIQVNLFDVYSGQQVAPGKKSFAYRIIFQSPNHTLTDAEVDKVQQQILDKLAQEMGASLR